MAAEIPSTTSQWTMTADKGFEGLRFEERVSLPELKSTECLVKIEAASLNYRDIAIPSGKYVRKFRDRIVPGSDGAGTIIAIGSEVTMFKVGDQVCTLFNQAHQDGFITQAILETSIGSHRDGVLRQYAAFDETALVPAPTTLSFGEASTLSCAATTAWNALYGVAGRALANGDYVLVQGTGGVSLFAAQIALTAGATVIATTSSDTKGEELKKLGVHHVINYKTDSAWGETAKKLTKDGQGLHHIIEVGGETTMAQSLKAVRCEGVISIIGFLGGRPESQLCSLDDLLKTRAIARGLSVASREQFIEMNKFIDEHKIKPHIDKRIFKFDELKEAYQYMDDQKHWGKIVIDIAGSH
ncbi:Zinc-type alcohol dehydrogenase-like protein [Pseudocercospora fuligena]|uniref:Zinc-type alcohol dehydrogenase-like protein n=1 Tax=Pseudocercospora fuligena TaxID=685502 RepID=A0A8H6VIG6_9PEZI|nr:Zinc-type alcohol dehydrogenase-like protein [Pseudocercospora fuligena]